MIGSTASGPGGSRGLAESARGIGRWGAGQARSRTFCQTSGASEHGAFCDGGHTSSAGERRLGSSNALLSLAPALGDAA